MYFNIFLWPYRRRFHVLYSILKFTAYKRQCTKMILHDVVKMYNTYICIYIFFPRAPAFYVRQMCRVVFVRNQKQKLRSLKTQQTIPMYCNVSQYISMSL